MKAPALVQQLPKTLAHPWRLLEYPVAPLLSNMLHCLQESFSSSADPSPPFVHLGQHDISGRKYDDM